MDDPRFEVIARRMAIAERPGWARAEDHWVDYLPQARMWLAAYDEYVQGMNASKSQNV